MKKTMSILLSFTLFLSMGITCMATENTPKTVAMDIVAVREDVSFKEARTDETFNVVMANRSISVNHTTSNAKASNSGNVYWKVWGEASWKSVDNVWGAVPIGYSAHMNGDTVDSVYHYTRTYLGALNKSGDSGRKWGYKTVKATGTFCDKEVWNSNKQYVKYGTES